MNAHCIYKTARLYLFYCCLIVLEIDFLLPFFTAVVLSEIGNSHYRAKLQWDLAATEIKESFFSLILFAVWSRTQQIKWTQRVCYAAEADSAGADADYRSAVVKRSL